MVTQDAVLQLVTAVLQVLSLLGLIVDPTTAGVADSQRALGYEEPYQQGDGAAIGDALHHEILADLISGHDQQGQKAHGNVAHNQPPFLL